MTRALVTGGAGFIGSHMVDRLVGSGREVRVIDNLTSGEQRLKFLEAAGVTVDRLDIRSEAAADLIGSFQPDEVYHFAAQMDVRRSVADPIYDADVNVLGTLRILEAAARAGARVMTASSGGCIYGEADPTRFPLDEHTPKNPDSPYGVTKSVMEDYLRFYRSIHDLQYVNLALGNVYGPRQDPAGEAGVVAIFGLRLLKGEPCHIFGDGSQTRDYIFVGDVAEAFFAAASKGSGETFNIGTGIETGVDDLYARMAVICGVDAQPLYQPARPGELDRSCLDSTKAGSMLGWSPSKDLNQGLTETVDFIRGRLGPP
ncbi:GDP-mannose 4,6-dehydratase [soil metagenome]